MIAGLPSPSVIAAAPSAYTSLVTAAKTAYDGLSSLQQMQFSPAEVNRLSSAFAALGPTDDEKAAEAVRQLIVALPSLETITVEAHGSQIRAAKVAYDALTDAQKAMIPPAEVDLLTGAVRALEALQSEPTEDDVKALQAFNAKVTAIGQSITTESESKITDARRAYTALTEKQKSYVDAGTYESLTNAEKVLEIVKQIDAIQSVTKDNMAAEEPKITAARQAYDALTDTQKKMVSNLSHLTSQEANLEALKAPVADTSLYSKQLDAVLAYLKQKMDAGPTYGSTNGEWSALAQVRGGKLSGATRTNYLGTLKNAVGRLDGKLDDTPGQVKHTEYERVVLALTALGMVSTRFDAGNGKAPYNLVEPLLKKFSGSYEYQVSEQGNNGTIFALLALDSGKYYAGTDADRKARESWIDTLADWQNKGDGSWPIYNSNQSGDGGRMDTRGGSIDITAMAVQALAPYYSSNTKARTAVDKALTYLSGKQDATGGYGSSEATAQVIVALSALGRDADKDTAFIKNGRSVLSGLLSYNDSATGGFCHTKDGGVNQMATEQAAYALVAYDRWKNGKTSLYDMSDVFTYTGT